MIHTETTYESCDELFASYPLAVRPGADGTTTVCSMVITLRHDDGADFYLLSYDDGGTSPAYFLRPWRGETIVKIAGDVRDDVPEVVKDVVSRGVPVPEHGSIFGWRQGRTVTALVIVYADPASGSVPSWAVMPLADMEPQQWPPFTREGSFGQWFWQYVDDSSLVSLGGLIASTRDTVLWADTKTTLGSSCCVVTRDVTSPDGYTLSRGRYVYHQTLLDGVTVPSVESLLASTSVIDLAPRFAVPIADN